MQGIIVKLLKDLYFVETENGVVESKARGVFRNKNISPIVGDRVDVEVNSDGSGLITDVYDRINSLKRPEVANVDLVIHIHSIVDPDINTYMLDKALVMSEFYGIDSIIIFSKNDITKQEDYEYYKDIYNKASYDVYKTSLDDSDISPILERLRSKTSVVSGPSGSGKSSFINRLNKDFNIVTSNVSKKTGRGRHTTRHIELLKISHDTHILDTPGFSSLDLSFIEDERELGNYFPEIRKLRPMCKFHNCLHINEPGCKVKEELGSEISETRYNNYLLFSEEIKELRRY